MIYKLLPIVFTVPFVLVILPRPVEAQTAPTAVTTCLTNAYCRVATVIIGGLYYWAVTQNGQTTHYPYTGEGEPGHLEDPEGDTEEWSDRIWAGSSGNAEAQCRQYAQNNGVIYVKVEHLGGRAYNCVVRTYRS